MGISINTTQVTGIDVLKNKAILVSLHRRKLNRNKTDRDISLEVQLSKRCNASDAIRVNKSIFSKAAVDRYSKVYNEASKYFYRCTLPWDEKGYRLMSIDIFDSFTKRFKKYTSEYREAVNEFIDGIQNHVEEMKAILGDAFNISDYSFLSSNGGVDRQMLMDQFSLEVEFNTVTGGDDLRCSLTEADREMIASQMDKAAMDKFGKAQEHIITSLLDCVASIHDRLSKSENIFRDTLISNLEDLVDLVPKMNIGNNPDIAKLAQDCRDMLCTWDPQTLREDDTKRDQVSKAADKILQQAKGLI